jgi:hypothetical protein
MWSAQVKRAKYSDFQDVLNAGTAKINEHYQRTAESDAYTFAMCKYYHPCSLPLANI